MNMVWKDLYHNVKMHGLTDTILLVILLLSLYLSVFSDVFGKVSGFKWSNEKNLCNYVHFGKKRLGNIS